MTGKFTFTMRKLCYKQIILPKQPSMICLLYNLPASFYQIFLPMRVFRHTTDLDGYLCKLAPNVGTVDSAYQHETHASRLEKNLAILIKY